MQPTDRELAELEALDELEREVRDFIADKLIDLRDKGVLRIHRDWSIAEETSKLAKASSGAAIEAILRSDWLSVHDLAYAQRGLETNYMHAARMRAEAAREPVAVIEITSPNAAAA